jgi:thiosulfate/3-mercaptopyruvate sulfurtransferase
MATDVAAALVIDAVDTPAFIAARDPVLLSVQTQIAPTPPSGFLKGALWIDQDSWTLDSRSQVQLDDLAQWSALFGALGIDGRRPVLVYDNGDLKFASRVRYLLGHFGTPATLINGGWPALAALVRAGKLTAQAGPSAAVYAPCHAVVTQPPIPIAPRAEVRASLDDPKVTLVDVRTPAEYIGTDVLPGITRPGHIPGAVNLPLANLFASPDTLMAPAQLRHTFAAAGLTGQTRPIFYCQDGARSSLGATAAVLAALPGASLYYLSYLDWQSDPADPVVPPPRLWSEQSGP